MIEEKIIFINFWYNSPKNYTGKAKLCDGVAWYKNGNLHRDDEPAIVYDSGTKYWCINGLNHRLSGPAYITNGYSKFYIHGKEYFEHEYWKHPLVVEYKLNRILSIT